VTGILNRWNEQGGYGFIKPLIGDPDAAEVFVHATGIAGLKPGERASIPEGAEVKFDLVRGKEGPQAANLRVLTLNGEILRRTPLLRSGAGAAEPGRANTARG
jgi:cold shock CspA family protein